MYNNAKLRPYSFTCRGILSNRLLYLVLSSASNSPLSTQCTLTCSMVGGCGTGYTHNIHRLYTGYVQGIYRLYIGYVQGIYRLYTRYVQGIHKVYT